MRAPSVVTVSLPEFKDVTSTGELRFVVVPSPSWPHALYPQHFKLLPVTVAHVDRELLASIEMTPLLSPATLTGTLLLLLVPSPSSPSLLRPQHFAAPVVSTAHVCSQPAAIEATFALNELTLVGTERYEFDASPNCP